MILAFAPEHNSHGKRDATGAFRPEALAFCRLHGALPAVLFDNRLDMTDRLRFARERIEAMQPGTLDTLAIFCHGWKDGIQLGARTRSACLLVDSIRRVAASDLRVILYCCDAARDDDDDRADDKEPGPGGDGGFADKLRDEMRAQGVRGTVFAHTTMGHTTHNPYVRRFDPGDLVGGHYIIKPHSPHWRAWHRALRGDLRFRFPFLSDLEILAELQQREGVA